MAATYLHTINLINKNVRLYLVSVALVGFTVDGGIYSVLFNLYLLRLGYGPEFVGLINSAGLLIFALVSLPAGVIGGRWGSRRTMITGLGLMLLGCSVLPLAEFSPAGWQAGWLLTSYVVIFLGLSLYFVNTAPFLMSNTGVI